RGEWIFLPRLAVQDRPAGEVRVGLVPPVDQVDIVKEGAIEGFVAEPLALAVDDDRVRLPDQLQGRAPQGLAFLILLAGNDEAERGDVGHPCNARPARSREPEMRAVDGGEYH